MNVPKNLGELFAFVREQGGSHRAIAVQRHGDYLTGHVRVRKPGMVESEFYAGNYGRAEPDCMWPLSKAGLEQCYAQACAMHEAGVVVSRIYGSHQGRGTETGQRLSEGFSLAGGGWVPFECARALDYPVYGLSEVKLALEKHGDDLVAVWLNGLWPGLVTSDTPRQFKGRVMGWLDDRFRSMRGGEVEIHTTHFELVLLVASLTMLGQDLGSVPTTWQPKKGGGIVLWTFEHSRDGTKVVAFEYGPDLSIVQEWTTVNAGRAGLTFAVPDRRTRSPRQTLG